MFWISFMLFSICFYLFYLLWNKKTNDIDDYDDDDDADDNDDDKMKLKVPNGPISLPLIGNMLQLGSKPFEKLFEWSYKYGPIFKIKLGSQTIVVLNGTDVIREALIENEEEFAGRPKLYMIHATLKGKGVISSPYNQDYTEHKRFLISSFNKFGKRRSSLETNCLQTIRETLDDYREKMDVNLDCANMFMKNSLSQIASQNVLTMTFGTRMHDKKTFSILMDLISENFKNTAVSAAFNFLPISRIFQTYILKNVFKCSEFLNTLISEKMKEFDDFTSFDQINESLNIEKSNKEDSQDSNIIECYLRELMNNVDFFTSNSSSTINHILSRNNNSAEFSRQSRKLTEKRRNSISDMNEKIRKGSLSSRYKSFSFDNLSSIVQDIFVAGTETVSTTLDWALIYAAYFPLYQKELHAEIDSVLGREKLPTESDRFKLANIEAFLNEAMRFHCAGPILIPRATTKNVIFKGCHLPKDTFVMVNIWSCMRDPAYWHNPDTFDPKRFIDAQTGKFNCKNPAMIPFSIGKRACIGESLARIQMFLIFTSLLQKFSFSFSNENDCLNEHLIDGLPGIGLRPPNVSLKISIR